MTTLDQRSNDASGEERAENAPAETPAMVERGGPDPKRHPRARFQVVHFVYLVLFGAGCVKIWQDATEALQDLEIETVMLKSFVIVLLVANVLHQGLIYVSINLFDESPDGNVGEQQAGIGQNWWRESGYNTALRAMILIALFTALGKVVVGISLEWSCVAFMVMFGLNLLWDVMDFCGGNRPPLEAWLQLTGPPIVRWFISDLCALFVWIAVYVVLIGDENGRQSALAIAAALVIFYILVILARFREWTGIITICFHQAKR